MRGRMYKQEMRCSIKRCAVFGNKATPSANGGFRRRRNFGRQADRAASAGRLRYFAFILILRVLILKEDDGPLGRRFRWRMRRDSWICRTGICRNFNSVQRLSTPWCKKKRPWSTLANNVTYMFTDRKWLVTVIPRILICVSRWMSDNVGGYWVWDLRLPSWKIISTDLARFGFKLFPRAHSATCPSSAFLDWALLAGITM